MICLMYNCLEDEILTLYLTSLAKSTGVHFRLTRSLARDLRVCSTAGLEVQTKSSQ